jgi:hypothetical protein
MIALTLVRVIERHSDELAAVSSVYDSGSAFRRIGKGLRIGSESPECRVTTLVAGRCRTFSFERSEWFAVFLNVVRRQSHRPLVRLLLSEFAQ